MRPSPGTRAQARAQARAAGARALAGKGVGWRILHSLWILPTFLIGFAGWVSFLYIGVRSHRRSWLLCGVGYLALTIAMLVMVGRSEPGGAGELTSSEGISAVLILAAWFVPAVHAFALIPERLRVRALDDVHPGFAVSGGPLAPPPTAAAPAPAYPGDGAYGADPYAPPAASGHGYAPPAPSGPGYTPSAPSGPGYAPPGVPGRYAPPPAGQGGLGPEEFFAGGGQPAAPIDLNVAPAEELARLPGMSPELARRAVDERTRRQGFADAEDFGVAIGLPPHQIARLRETAVAGPRPSATRHDRRNPPGDGPRIVDA